MKIISILPSYGLSKETNSTGCFCLVTTVPVGANNFFSADHYNGSCQDVLEIVFLLAFVIKAVRKKILKSVSWVLDLSEYTCK